MVQRIIFYFQISFFYSQVLPMSEAWNRMVTSKHSFFSMTWSLAWLVERYGLYVKKLISEAKKVVSVLDEAFTILALMNYWERWTGNGTARWTDSKAGNYQYMGWADVAYLQFDELCKRIREQRQTRLNKKLEQMYLARSRSLLAGGGPHSQRLGRLVETNVKVYNELDSEEED
jgi:hypothetical protein